MKLPVMVDIEDFSNDLDAGDALEFIKAVDLGQADWDFTIKVAKHFISILQASELKPWRTDWLYELKRENT